MPLYEFCAENITLLEKAFQAGARRVELCDNLAVGGTTPSNAVIKEAVRLAKEYQAKVIVMIRPRGGDFVYSEQELDIMLEDWKIARDLGVDGLAVGALTADNQLDKDAMLCFIQASQGYELTMHMAFDQIPLEDQASTIEWMKEVGVTRLLTRAGSPETDLEQRLARYEEYAKLVDGQVEILAGGGVSLENRQLFLDVPGVDQVHGTRVVF